MATLNCINRQIDLSFACLGCVVSSKVFTFVIAPSGPMIVADMHAEVLKRQLPALVLRTNGWQQQYTRDTKELRLNYG